MLIGQANGEIDTIHLPKNQKNEIKYSIRLLIFFSLSLFILSADHFSRSYFNFNLIFFSFLSLLFLFLSPLLLYPYRSYAQGRCLGCYPVSLYPCLFSSFFSFFFRFRSVSFSFWYFHKNVASFGFLPILPCCGTRVLSFVFNRFVLAVRFTRTKYSEGKQS